MKAKQLRIGNLVWSNYGSYDRLEDYVVLLHEDFLLTKGHGKSNIAFHFIEPIPLTEECLLKFGFEQRESSTCDAWYIGFNEITKDWLFDLVWLKKPELINAPDFPFFKNGRHVIEHVHQLQNLYFALTGEELTIKEQ